MSEKKRKVIISAVICLWIIIINLVALLVRDQLAPIGYSNWSFFLITVLFFLIEDENLKRKFASVFLGSCTGIILAGLMVVAEQWLAAAGLSHIPAIMLPLSACLALIIIVHSLFPLVFNNCAFAYFLVSLMNAEAAFTGIPGYIGSAFAGHIIVNVGIIIIVRFMAKAFAKKGSSPDGQLESKGSSATNE